MYKAFGIINSSGKNVHVEGLQDYRPIGAFSFLEDIVLLTSQFQT